jgi:hypothetical protein
MLDKFNFYDVLGYLIPGAIVTLALYWVGTTAFELTLPPLQTDLASSLVFIGVSYVVGHAVQAIGDRWEEEFNVKGGGRLSELLLLPNPPGTVDPGLFSPQLSQHIIELATSQFSLPCEPEGCAEARAWRQELFEHCYALMIQESCVQRTDIFLAINGLSRGVYMASGIAFIASLVIVLKESIVRALSTLNLAPATVASKGDMQVLVFGLAGLGASVVIGLLMRQVFNRYRRYFAKSVYFNFVAWSEKKRTAA